MDRLTYRDKDGRARLTKYGMQMYCSTQATADCFAKLEESLAAYEDTGLEPEEVAEYKKFEDEAVSKNVPFSRIIEMMNAESEGRLIVLPCKVGDTVYRLSGLIGYPIVRESVTDRAWLDGIGTVRLDCGKICGWEDFGKTVFLTREEAEAALGGGEDGV